MSFLELKLENSLSVVFGNMYRRPNTNTVDFLNSLSQILETLESGSKKVIVVGDINFTLFNYNYSDSILNYVSLFHSHNYLNLINKPTRVTNTSYSLIDNIWTNIYANHKKSGIIHSKISDHFPVMSVFEIGKKKTNFVTHEFITLRDFSEANYLRFSEELSEVQWDLVTSTNDPNVAYFYFSTFVCNLCNKCFPLVTKKIRTKYKNKSYVTSEIRAMMKERDKVYIIC